MEVTCPHVIQLTEVTEKQALKLRSPDFYTSRTERDGFFGANPGRWCSICMDFVPPFQEGGTPWNLRS